MAPEGSNVISLSARAERCTVEFEARSFRGAGFDDARDAAREQAEDQAAATAREAIEENLPADAEPAEWNWQALASWANGRSGLNLKDKDLRKFAVGAREALELDREALAEFLTEKAVATIRQVDLTPAEEFLRDDWGRRSLASRPRSCTWAASPAPRPPSRRRQARPGPGARRDPGSGGSPRCRSGSTGHPGPRGR